MKSNLYATLVNYISIIFERRTSTIVQASIACYFLKLQSAKIPQYDIILFFYGRFDPDFNF